MQRDPGAGGAMRIGAGGAAPVGRFIPRDPTVTNQYADGPNLYQYVRSNPTNYLDPAGRRAGPTNFYHLRNYSKKGKLKILGKKVRHTIISFSGAVGDQSGADFAPPGKKKLIACLFECEGSSTAARLVIELKGAPWNQNHRLWIRDDKWLKYPERPRVCCRDATAEQVKACLIKKSGKWDRTTFYLIGRNCMHFAEEAETDCCLKKQ